MANCITLAVWVVLYQPNTYSLYGGSPSSTRFHSIIESGAIIHAFVGEERPPAASILKLVEKTFRNTKAAQLAISPEFTICNSCGKVTAGLKDNCGVCNSEDVYGVTRIVGYYSRIDNWNLSKRGELKDRQGGSYSVQGV